MLNEVGFWCLEKMAQTHHDPQKVNPRGCHGLMLRPTTSEGAFVRLRVAWWFLDLIHYGNEFLGFRGVIETLLVNKELS
jgi:hypothetical protein